MIVNIVSQVLGHFHAFGSYSNTASHASHCIGITTKRNGITNCRSIRISPIRDKIAISCMGRELAYLSSHATNRYFIPNWGRYW